jgi:hypothetical protein
VQSQSDEEKPRKSDNGIKLVGKWKAVLTRGSETVCEKEGYNTICTAGLHAFVGELASAAISATRNPFYFIAIGSDNTAEAAGDTALGTELSRHTGTVTAFTAVYQVKATFASGSGTGNVYEYGLFDANSTGNMLSRDTEALITKGANDTLTVTAQITLA